MRVYIAADHRGFRLKEYLFKKLQEKYEVYAVGSPLLQPDDDYPDVTMALIDAMNHDVDTRGIVICGSGVGVCIAANRFAHVRCGLCTSPQQARAARTDDDITILALGSDTTSEDAAWEITRVFLETPFSGNERHMRRIEKLSQL